MINLLLHHHHHHRARLPRNTVSGVVVAQAWERARTDARTHSSTITILPALSCFRAHDRTMSRVTLKSKESSTSNNGTTSRPRLRGPGDVQPAAWRKCKGMSAVHRKLRPLRHDVTVFTSTVNQTHMMPPDCLECTSTCRFKKKSPVISCVQPSKEEKKKKKKRVHLSLYRMNFSFCGQSRGKWLRLGRRRNSDGGGGGGAFRQSDQNFQEKNVLYMFPVHTEHEANMHRKLAKQLKFGARAEGETMEFDYIFK